MEQAPRLAQALAAGLNVTVGELRKLAEQGALTSQTVIGALQGQSVTLQAEFDKMPPTVERALGRLSAAWEIYIGHADGATGATGTAARAIEALTGHLDVLGNVLLGLGKAAAVYGAVRLAAAYFSTLTTATAAATAATVAHTAAVQANTAAQAANAAASATTTAGVGRLASALDGIKGFALAAVLTNLEALGKAIGEGAAKLMGYGKAMEEAERKADAEAEATRRAAAQKAALAQATAQATDKALGLNKAARELVTEFEGVVTKTNDTKDALEKLTKALRLDDLAGIRAAGAALDALGQRGKLSADQIKGALTDALKGADLLVFETQARAVFDNSEQGARRLKAAIDAIADESLRRAGTSAQELQTGFSQAANSAINDVDKLAQTLRTLGAASDDTGRVLATALDKALAAANTERAVRAVLARVEDLGKTGMLTGDRLTDSLEKVRKKPDELRPGISSLDEAMRAFGLQTRAELQQTADRLGDAYRTISTAAGVSLRDQIEAYGKWREAALKATGGIESGHLAEQRVILASRAAVAGLGDEYAKTQGKADTAIGKTKQSVNELGEEVNAAGERINQMAAGFDNVHDYLVRVRGCVRNAATAASSLFDVKAGRYDAEGFAKNTAGQRVTATGQLKPPDDSGNWEFVTENRPNVAAAAAEYPSLAVSGGYWKRKPGTSASPSSTFNTGPARPSASNPGTSYTTPTPSAVSQGKVITLQLGSQSTSFTVGSEAEAARLESFLAALGTASSRASV